MESTANPTQDEQARIKQKGLSELISLELLDLLEVEMQPEELQNIHTATLEHLYSQLSRWTQLTDAERRARIQRTKQQPLNLDTAPGNTP